MMPTEAAISFDNATLAANLAAINIRQPELAQRLRQCTAPPEARLVTGRDGTSTVRLGTTGSTIHWLGGSSMPSVSAPAALFDYADQGTNVILPGIGTGHEPKAMAGRIARHCAVFVYEPDPTLIALALSVVDLAELIEQGRVVIVDDTADESLPRFFAEHVGFDFPTQLHPIPGIDRDELQSRIAAVERTGPVVHNTRRRLADQLAKAIRSRETSATGARPRILLLSIDAATNVRELAEAVGRAANQLRWPHARCLPEWPEHCSHLARLQAIQNHQPELILFINCTPGPLLERLPETMPWACWFLESAVLPGTSLEGLPACRHLLASSVAVQDQLLARGASPDNVVVLEPGVDAVAFAQDSSSQPSAISQDRDPADGSANKRRPESDVPLVILADGQNISPTAAGIGLDSHAKLWTRLTNLIAAEAEKHEPGRLDGLLLRAEKLTGIHLTDEKLRADFCALAAGRLGQTIVVRSAVEKLLAVFPDLGLWGRNWGLHDNVKHVHRGSIPTASRRRGIYAQARLFVAPCLDFDIVGYCCEALAAGCCPIIRRPQEEILQRYPQTGDILASLPSFADFTELAETARQLTEDPDRRAEAVAEPRQRLLAEHTVAHRLRTISQLLGPSVS